MSAYDVVASVNGVALVAGDVVTGADIDDLVIYNGVVRVTRVDVDGSGIVADGHPRWMLQRKPAGSDTYTNAWGVFADWTFFCHSETQNPDRVRIVTATPDLVEWVDEWDSYALNVASLGGNGIVNRDDANGANYTSGAVTKYITETTLRAVGRLERGAEGYFFGYHSDPRVGPGPRNLPDLNNESAYGERERGTGGGSRVFFSSSGFQCLHPDWGADSRWGVYSPTNRHAWAGIDDPTYGVQAEAEYIALQADGFPAEQADGPWWVADVPSDNATDRPFCRYVHMVGRMECGSFQFDDSHYGSTVIHFVNEYQAPGGNPYEYQLFMGAAQYTSANLAVEPTGSLRGMIAARAPARWPASGDTGLSSFAAGPRPSNRAPGRHYNSSTGFA